LRIYTPTRSRYFIVFISGILAICYGAVDEIHQLLVAKRVADIGDLAADGFGAFLASWGWSQAERRWPWLR
jgi:VanZ family protein